MHTKSTIASLIYVTLVNGDEIYTVLPQNSKSIVEKLLHESIQAWKIFPNGYDPDLIGYSPCVFGVSLKDNSPESQLQASKEIQALLDPAYLEENGNYSLFTVPTPYGDVIAAKLVANHSYKLLDAGELSEEALKKFVSQFQ